MEYIFLDSNVYIGENFDFDRYKLKLLAEKIHSGTAKLLYSSIIENEILNKLNILESQLITNTKKSIKDLKKKSIFLNSTTDTFIDESKILESINFKCSTIKKRLKDFLFKTNAIKIPLETVNLDICFKNYFECSPPFSQNKRKEFPDYIFLSSLLNWAIDHKKIS